ncbi:MAG: hypothetical protein ACRD18_12670 [Terriglobia bacterium]
MGFSRGAWITGLGLACALTLYPSILRARHHDNEPDLTARIQRENNPVKRAKLEIRMGKLLLDQAAAAYDHHQIPQGQKLLSSFTGEMQDAWKLLESSGRNAAKKPDGFMQLEIALRENARALNGLRERVFYLYRGPIDKTLKTLNQVHSRVLVQLFPGAVPPSAASPAAKGVPALQNTKRGANSGAGKGSHP